MSMVEIRRYDSMGAFQKEAAIMAVAGWKIAAQSSGSKISNAGSWCAVLGIFMAIGGFLVWFPLVILGIVFVVIGAASRETTYTVTYQPG